MTKHIKGLGRRSAVGLGLVALGGVVPLFAFDVAPGFFSARAHDWLGAFPLAMIAVAYLVYQSMQRPTRREWVRAFILAAAFLFWAANQCWREPHQAMVCNDIAIALFVLDVVLVMIDWPASADIAATKGVPRH